MSLELAEHSIQLLKCHTSRWRLCHCSPQDNQSKSWKKCGLCIFCHWSLLRPLAPAGQSIQLLICHISRRRLCHLSPQDNQSKSWEKVWPLVLLSQHLGPVYCWCTKGWEYLLKFKKELKLFLSVRPSTALTSFFSIQIFGVMQSIQLR